MNAIIEILDTLPPVASLVIKGTVLLGLAGLLVAVARNTSAADRHAVWITALAVVLLLPVTNFLVPSWQISIQVEKETSIEEIFEEETRFEHIHEEVIVSETPLEEMQIDTPVNQSPNPDVQRSQTSYGAVITSWISPLLADWKLLLGSLWILGVLLFGGRWLMAYISAGRMVRESIPVEDEAWLDRAYEIGYEMDAPEDVHLHSSDRLAVPVAWCFGQPVIILPGDYQEFDDELRDIVLRHELAHIVRRDGWSQVIAQVSVAVNWFNPLAWYAWKQVLVERERACDDMVLAAGTTPSTYADYLLRISRRFQSPSLALAAVASMARHSDLHTRVTSILDHHRSRHAMRGLPAFLVLLVALPLAAFQLGIETDKTTTVAQEITDIAAFEPVAEVSVDDQSNDWTWSGRVSSNGEVEIHSVNGAVNVRSGSGDRVEIVGRVLRQRDDGARLEVVERGNSVIICIMHDGLRNCAPGGPQGSAENNRLSEVEVTVTMPAGVSLHAESVNGAVSIPDHEAAVLVETVNGRVTAQSSGNIHVRSTNGALNITGGGNIQASTTNGRITLHSTASNDYSVNASTANGAISARFDHSSWQNNASFSTTNGRIRVELPVEPNTTVNAHSNRGRISSNLPLEIDRSGRGASAQGTFGRGGRGLILETNGGAIEIVSGAATGSLPNTTEHSMTGMELSMDILSGDWLADVVEISLSAAEAALDTVDLSELSAEERLQVEREMAEARREIAEMDYSEMLADFAEAQADLEVARQELAEIDFDRIRADLEEAGVELSQVAAELRALEDLEFNIDLSGIFDRLDNLFRDAGVDDE